MAKIKVSAKETVEQQGKLSCCSRNKVFYDDKELDRVIGVYPEGDKLILEFNIKQQKTLKDYEIEFEV